MEEETNKTEETAAAAPEAAPVKRERRNAPRGSQRPQRGRRPAERERVRPEFDQKILDIRRVTRVVAGGRRFSFSVALVAGDRKGRVGVGTGKAGETALAIEKAMRSAKKAMIRVPLTKNGSISHDVDAKYASAWVVIRPAPERGLIAGSAVRSVLELAGVKDVTSKILSGSKNRLNNAQAAIKALTGLKARN